MGKLDLVTIIIIAANVIISYKGFGDFGFFEKYKFNVGAVRRGEQFRLFSSGFLHIDNAHLFFNMFSFLHNKMIPYGKANILITKYKF